MMTHFGFWPEKPQAHLCRLKSLDFYYFSKAVAVTNKAQFSVP